MKNLSFFKNMLKQFFGKNAKKESRWQTISLLSHFLFVIILCYFLADFILSLLVSTITPPSQERFNPIRQKVSPYNSLNYFELSKKIKQRNLFNAEGKLANENLKPEKREFDLRGPCPASSLPLELRGTIVSGEQTFATIIQGQSTLVFRKGQSIPKYPNLTVVDIREKGVILNNDGKKECLYLIKGLKSLSQLPKKKKTAQVKKTSQQVRTINLESKWVESQLGPNFSHIMKAIYTVPETDDDNGQILGYKLYRIKPMSLLGKMGLKDQDIITTINDKSMKNNNIFLLYEGLHNDSEVKIQYERDGVSYSIKVKVI